jgi:TonB family protein
MYDRIVADFRTRIDHGRLAGQVVVHKLRISHAATAVRIVAPRKLKPRRTLEAEKEGFVRLRITMGTEGSVVDATVVDARPSGWFERAAVDAVKRWRYQPSGRTIQTDVEIEFIRTSRGSSLSQAASRSLRPLSHSTM